LCCAFLFLLHEETASETCCSDAVGLFNDAWPCVWVGARATPRYRCPSLLAGRPSGCWSTARASAALCAISRARSGLATVRLARPPPTTSFKAQVRLWAFGSPICIRVFGSSSLLPFGCALARMSRRLAFICAAAGGQPPCRDRPCSSRITARRSPPAISRILCVVQGGSVLMMNLCMNDRATDGQVKRPNHRRPSHRRPSHRRPSHRRPSHSRPRVRRPRTS
jgi:hypothetical protein